MANREIFRRALKLRVRGADTRSVASLTVGRSGRQYPAPLASQILTAACLAGAVLLLPAAAIVLWTAQIPVLGFLLSWGLLSLVLVLTRRNGAPLPHR